MAGQPVKKPTILVVDDEKVIRELCVKVLSDYRVLQADNIADAIQIFCSDHCDLVLSDVMMPGGSGLDLLRDIKKCDPHAVVIIMTGFSDREIILNALKEGADDFISKPLNILQLRTIVEKSLSRKNLKEELASLKRLDHLKNNFLSIISHKLRTPITTISLFFQDIQHELYRSIDPDFSRNASIVQAEVDYLGQLVADLLEFSQMMGENGTLDLKECSLNEILSDLLQLFRKSRIKSGIECNYTAAQILPMKIDREKISFVFQQIIDNALKFSRETGTINIRLDTVADKAVVTVYDTGAGIPHNEISKVFEKFYQIDPENTGQVRGFGLGLYYAREFVRHHGGSIGIESESGKGTTVTVTLPML